MLHLALQLDPITFKTLFIYSIIIKLLKAHFFPAIFDLELLLTHAARTLLFLSTDMVCLLDSCLNFGAPISRTHLDLLVEIPYSPCCCSLKAYRFVEHFPCLNS